VVAHEKALRARDLAEALLHEGFGELFQSEFGRLAEAVKGSQELQALVQMFVAFRHADTNWLFQVTVGKIIDSVEVLCLQVKSGHDGGEDTESFGSEGGSIEVVVGKCWLQIPSYADPCSVLL
jgi:hypothetical protein